MASASSFKIEASYFNRSSKSFFSLFFLAFFWYELKNPLFALACLAVFLSQLADEELPKTRSTGIL
jgi:hypothetical protein